MKKFKRILSTLLTLAMIISCFAGVSVQAADEAVTVTYKGVTIDGVTDMPLEFAATVNFPAPLAVGTDLSGIELWDDDMETINVTITPVVTTTTDEATGETTSQILSATMQTPVLKQGTEYTIYIPDDLDGNGMVGAMPMFYTIDSPYLFSEDFDGDKLPATEWKKGGSGNAQDAPYVKFDGSAVTFSHMSSSYQNPRYDFKTNIDLSSTKEAVIETRVKLTNVPTGYLLADGSVYSGNRTMFQVVGGNNSYVVDWAGLKTTKSGYVSIGGNGDNNNEACAFTTDYKIYANTWYTLRLTLSSDRKYVNWYIVDENGKSYESGFIKGSNNGVQNIDYIDYSYSGFAYGINIDYLRIWENDGLGTVSATYTDAASNMVALSGAKDVDIDNAVSAILTFTNAISEDDLSAINLPGTSSTATLSNDGLKAYVSMAGMDYATVYSLSVPEIAGNKATTFLFETENAPVPTVTYGEDSVLDGATDVPEEFTAKITFGKPIATDSDLSGIVLSGGELKATIVDSKTITLDVSGLEKRISYTLTIPDMGENPGATYTFTTADEDWYIWRAEFDGFDPEMIRDEAGTIENGVLNLPVSAGSSVGYVKFDPAIDISANKNLVFEARIKYNNRNASEDKLVKCSQGILMFTGKSINERVAIFSKQGKLAYGGANYGGAEVVTDYDLVEDEWYTFTVKFNEAKNKFTLTVSDDNGNVYEGEEIQTAYGLAINTLNEITLQYRYEVSSVIDYLRVWDEDLLPVVKASHGEYSEELEGAGAVKGGEEVLISFPFAIEEADLAKIKVDGSLASATLSNDGLTATVTLPAFTPRTFHKLTVDAIGDNKAAEFTFRAADEGKYIYRAEFDGYDDDSVWYTILNGGVTGKNNQNADTEQGVYVSSYQNNRYSAFDLIFENYKEANYQFNDKTPRESHKIDLAGKENITIETRVKMGEGILDNQFMYMGFVMAMLGIGENNELRYDANGGGAKGEPFMVNDKEFTIEPNVWYTIKFNMDLKAHKYSISVDNGMGDIANSGTLNFIYNNTRTNIVDFRFSRMLNDQYASQTIDYFRIIDEDYGKVKITYDDGVALSNSVLIEADDVYTFTAMKDVTDTSNITLVDENGEMIAIDCTADGNVVTIDPVDSEMNYNTKYTLTIPKTSIGSDSDQVVTFATVWNKEAEFEYPAGYSADDELNVVFFGGSITNQNGWRKYTTEWFAEKFPNATCYNSAVGGTGSEYGWIRLGKDVISKNPDVVFVEFAVNDSTSTTTTKYMESIVRNLNALDKKPVIVFVYTANINFATNIYTISEHERLAKAYGIPTINIHDYAQSLYNTDAQFATDWDNKVYLGDGTHPNDAGNKLYGEYVTALLTSESSKYFVKPASNASVKALTDYKDYVYDYKNIDKTLTTEDNTYTLDFTGSEFILQYRRTTQSGKVKIVIDGDEENATIVDTYGDSMPFGHQLTFMDLPVGKHTATITLLTDEANNNITLGTQTFQIMCAYWKGADAEFEKPVFDAESVEEGKLLTATVNYTADYEENVYLAIALYDADGRFTRLSKIVTTTDSTGNDKEISVSIIPEAGDVKAKAFIWDSVSGMKALAENAAIGF